MISFNFQNYTDIIHSIPEMSSCLHVGPASGQEEIARACQEYTCLTSKTSRSLGSDRKESGQGDRESNVQLNDQEERKKGRKKIGATR